MMMPTQPVITTGRTTSPAASRAARVKVNTCVAGPVRPHTTTSLASAALTISSQPIRCTPSKPASRICPSDRAERMSGTTTRVS